MTLKIDFSTNRNIILLTCWITSLIIIRTTGCSVWKCAHIINIYKVGSSTDVFR